MPKSIQTAALTCLLALLPVIGTGQTCETASIPATTPISQFTINNNGTVIDTKTGLMWKRCSEGQTWSGATCSGSGASFTWQAALQRAQIHNGSGFAGFKDWRLPNIKELFSIIEKQCFGPAINLTIFPNTLNKMFWSSSPDTTYGTNALYVIFNLGSVDSDHKAHHSHWMRLVRSGQ